MIYIKELNTTFFTDNEKDISEIMEEAKKECNRKEETIQFICDILMIDAEEHNGTYFKYVH